MSKDISAIPLVYGMIILIMLDVALFMYANVMVNDITHKLFLIIISLTSMFGKLLGWIYLFKQKDDIVIKGSDSE